MTLTYVYCLVRSTRQPSIRHVPAGVPGSRGVYALDAEDRRWVMASRVPAAEYGERALAERLGDLDWVGPRALAHEAVVEHFLRAEAVLPFPLMTLFTSDERALDHLARHGARLDRLLARIAGQHEWGVRVTLEPRAEPVRARRGAPSAESGLAYLSRKRDQLGGHARQVRAARADGNRLYTALAREATAAVRRRATERAAPGSRLLVDAAFLVPVTRTRHFQSLLRKHQRSLGSSGVAVTVTGPWPPYHFVRAGARGGRS